MSGCSSYCYWILICCILSYSYLSMSDYIKRLIAEGEHQMLDFKFEVSDFRKIARTLVAFSNTDGGRLLIGVKDNGIIAGVRSEEEYFMIEGASRIYCKPEVQFKIREWQVAGKKIVEVLITHGENRPFKAMDPDGNWIAYIRQGDQNLVASPIILKVWERQKSGKATTIHFRRAEVALLSYLESNPSITVPQFRRLAGLSMFLAERILVDFIMLGLLKLEHSETNVKFSLAPGYRDIIADLDQSSD
jgi:predicted HTH transcriptional regulator